MLPDISFKRGNQTSGQPLPGTDYISGAIFYNNSLPTGFPSIGSVACFSLSDAVAAGITNTSVDETAATGVIDITNDGAAGDTILIQVQEPYGLVTLGTYTVTSADTTPTLTATHLTTYLNTQTLLNGGYTATSSGADVTITARPGLGIALNTGTNLIVTLITSTLTVTLTQFSGGVASKINIYYYHVSEFFRINPQGKLWVGIYAVPGSFNGNELNTLQNASGGEIKQCLMYVDQHAFATADIIAINTIAAALDVAHMPVSVLLAPDCSAVSNLSTLTNTGTLNSEWVSTIISQDGAAQGNFLYKTRGKSITNGGAKLGTVSVGKVSQSIANPSTTFNISDGTENEVAAFSNGNLYSTILATNPNLLTQLDNYNYIFDRKFVGQSGTWASGEWTAILQSSNYCHISDNRVISKMERLIYPVMLPLVLESEIQLNADGTIFFPVVKSLESSGDNALAIMGTNNEISGIQTIVNPTQVMSPGTTFALAVNYVQNFIARQVIISLNKVTSLS